MRPCYDSGDGTALLAKIRQVELCFLPASSGGHGGFHHDAAGDSAGSLLEPAAAGGAAVFHCGAPHPAAAFKDHTHRRQAALRSGPVFEIDTVGGTGEGAGRAGGPEFLAADVQHWGSVVRDRGRIEPDRDGRDRSSAGGGGSYFGISSHPTNGGRWFKDGKLVAVCNGHNPLTEAAACSGKRNTVRDGVWKRTQRLTRTAVS